ncbi:hypothetical protein D049_0660A, partial [Vibrio parahaemolyticus VPTS-2010]|jgi:heat shock protein 1/8
MVLDA